MKAVSIKYAINSLNSFFDQLLLTSDFERIRAIF